MVEQLNSIKQLAFLKLNNDALNLCNIKNYIKNKSFIGRQIYKEYNGQQWLADIEDLDGDFYRVKFVTDGMVEYIKEDDIIPLLKK